MITIFPVLFSTALVYNNYLHVIIVSVAFNFLKSPVWGNILYSLALGDLLLPCSGHVLIAP